jgi:hypothetical protein
MALYQHSRGSPLFHVMLAPTCPVYLCKPQPSDITKQLPQSESLHVFMGERAHCPVFDTYVMQPDEIDSMQSDGQPAWQLVNSFATANDAEAVRCAVRDDQQQYAPRTTLATAAPPSSNCTVL